MTMFSSKPQWAKVGSSVTVYSVSEPEYRGAYTQNNPTNPILDFTRWYAEGRMHQIDRVALFVMQAWDDSLMVVQEATDAERDHAWKVLTRLANFGSVKT